MADEICVVIAAYNGAKFIAQQMDSIRIQSLQPDKVMIIDDCSSDNTAAIVAEYIEDYGLKNWYFSIHNHNEGYIKTFWDAIDRTSEKYIFLCDQDDIWHPEKVRLMYEFMKSHRDCFVLCSDFEPLYEQISESLYSPSARKR